MASPKKQSGGRYMNDVPRSHPSSSPPGLTVSTRIDGPEVLREPSLKHRLSLELEEYGRKVPAGLAPSRDVKVASLSSWAMGQVRLANTHGRELVGEVPKGQAVALNFFHLSLSCESTVSVSLETSSPPIANTEKIDVKG